MEGLRRLLRRVGGPHHWVVRQSSHLAAAPLEEPDFAAAHAKPPAVHLVLPKEHATLLVPRDDGVLEPHVPSTEALRQVREVESHSLALRTRAHTALAGACEAQSREMQPAGLKFAYWLRAAPHTDRSAVSHLHCCVCRESCPCWGTHMWHDCVAVALAVSAGWRALADL